jgi:hypothetical protein
MPARLTKSNRWWKAEAFAIAKKKLFGRVGRGSAWERPTPLGVLTGRRCSQGRRLAWLLDITVTASIAPPTVAKFRALVELGPQGILSRPALQNKKICSPP